MLTHEDDLFGRVAVFNKLVTLDQIVECARGISEELIADRPRRSLATMLILKGYLSAQQAGAIEAALRKSAAEAGRKVVESSAPTPKPEPMEERAEAGDSRIMLAVWLKDDGDPAAMSAEADRAAAVVDEAAEAERLEKIVHKVAPGRIYPEMLEFIVRERTVVISPSAMAKAIGEPRAEVITALKHWQANGVLRKIGTHPYNFSPTAQQAEEIDLFLKAWSDPDRHSLMLGFILSAE